MMANPIVDRSATQTDQAHLTELGRRIRQRRLERNWTQAQLAEAAGLDRTTIGGLEREGSATLLSLVQVLRALGAPCPTCEGRPLQDAESTDDARPIFSYLMDHDEVRPVMRGVVADG